MYILGLLDWRYQKRGFLCLLPLGEGGQKGRMKAPGDGIGSVCEANCFIAGIPHLSRQSRDCSHPKGKD
jgi:hypothetical protein